MSRKAKITQELIEKEEQKLREMEQRAEIQKAHVADIKQQLLFKEFSEAESVLSAKGLSIRQILSAVEKGNLNDILPNETKETDTAKEQNKDI